MPKLTKSFIGSLQPRVTEYFEWDEELRGFGVRVLPSGRKTFVVQYRNGRKSRRMNIGKFGVLTADAARSLGLQALAKIETGLDPLDERQAKRNRINVEELVAIFDERHILLNPRLKASTGREYRHALKRYILPALGKLKVEEVTRADVARLHTSMADRIYQANRTLEVVSKMFNLAEEWGYRPEGSNPRKRIPKYPERKRERYLSAAELRRIGQVLDEMAGERVEMASAIAAVRLLMLTGCRLNEIMTLEWKHVHLRSSELRLDDSKTGAKVVQLGKAAVEVLRQIPRNQDNRWVLSGKMEGGRLTDLQPFWQRVRARAGLNGVRIHDLRHTFASVAAAQGMSLSMIGKMLGHSQIQTTARYAHLSAGTVRDAANDVASTISENLAGRQHERTRVRHKW